TDFGRNGEERATSIAIQPDGKLVIAGYGVGKNAGVTGTDFAIARYNSDGSLDKSFNGDGKVLTNFTGSSSDSASSVLIQPDNKFVVTGTSYLSGNDIAIARYNSNGSLDSAFGKDGRVITDFGRIDVASSSALQTDGKIVVAGYTNGISNYYNAALIRYNTNGSLDNTFGKNGRVVTNFGGFNETASAVVLQSSGKIVIGGLSQPNDSDFALARYSSDGLLDNSFGKNGIVTTNFEKPFNSSESIKDIAIQPDGKIVAVGSKNSSGFAIARYIAFGK
ncbi:MAG: delta-60 repeat domain-containing protein, partial [Acidobacteriota bacterium]|nr:delta-60 repeat domain-containing protein [Acidobacteriota bacterium]